MDMAPGPAVRALPEVYRGQRLGRGDPEQQCAQTRVPDSRLSSTRSAPRVESHSKPAPKAASSPSTSGVWPRPQDLRHDQSWTSTTASLPHSRPRDPDCPGTVPEGVEPRLRH